ncbi:AAA family ATPase [Streptomyces collinus]|uniref:DNA-binding CsgD family transcriptional regulator n=1 Tax=Streptomyces collinus TaxID=42684 RepID=A0AA89TE35_STRCU|nr:LuxR family transcriptional regulator [Streptomyces collinus]MBB5809726.1 DNA-binding CsgD family transcriptional regulator [Streptomyces collinus]WMX63045.1 AAA family ATPase [Streptomyces collinus]
MLYGRQKELHSLSRLVAEARAGRGGALIVEGDAGVGKTALLRRAVAAAGSGTRVLTCSGVQAEVALAFGGLQRLLTPLLDRLPELPDDQVTALRSALGLSTAPATDLMVRTAVLSLLDRAAVRTPLLLVADDLHWLDPATAGVLLYAARRLEGRPIAFLAAVREAGETTRDLPRLTLRGLAQDAASALLDEHGWGTPGPARRAVADAVGGNPLALQELVRLGSPAEVAEKVVLTGTAPLSLRLREVFAERTRELPESARTLLLVAAAEDSGHTGTVLAAARRLAVDEQALDVVEAAGYLEEVSGARLRFRHPLVRAAVYADASARRRALAHRALADELAARPPEGGQRERAVWQRALAATGPDEQLAEALEAGAATVRRRGGLAVAAAVLHRAALLSPTERQRTRRLAAAAEAAWKSGSPQLAQPLLREALSHPADGGTQLELDRLRGMMELWGGDQQAATARLLDSAAALINHSPGQAVTLAFMAVDGALRSDRTDEALRAARLIEAAGGEDPGYARYGSWLADAVAGRPRDGLTPWQILQAAPEDLSRNDAHRHVWPAALSNLGPSPRTARSFILEACDRFATSGMLAVRGLLLSWLADMEYRIGLWPECEAHAQEGLRMARDVGQPVLEADLLAVLALLSAGRGEAAECRAYAERAQALAVPQGNRSAAGTAQWALGRLSLAAGEYAEACERLAALGEPGSPFAHRQVARQAVLDVVEAQVRVDRREAAEHSAWAFEEWSERTTLAWPELSRHGIRALLAEGDTADKHFQAALSAPGAADAPLARGHTALLYGEWLRRNRREGEARTQLRSALETLAGLGARDEAERARAQLRAAGGAPRQRGGDPSARLTVQELQVAQLAAEGLSNREIGARLSLSPRTVGYHLYKVFPKLGISSRSQLRDADLDAVG